MDVKAYLIKLKEDSSDRVSEWASTHSGFRCGANAPWPMGNPLRVFANRQNVTRSALNQGDQSRDGSN